MIAQALRIEPSTATRGALLAREQGRAGRQGSLLNKARELLGREGAIRCQSDSKPSENYHSYPQPYPQPTQGQPEKKPDPR